MKKVFLFITIIIALTSCSLEDDGQNFEIETLPIKTAELPDNFQFGNSYDVTIAYDLPDACHSFYDLFYKYEGTARVVAINSIISNQTTCTPSIIEKEHTFKVIVNQREDYTFKLWKGTDNNGNNIFEEIKVPVIVDNPQ